MADFAKEDAQSALSAIKGKHGEGFSAIAFALAGDVANANRAIDDLTKRFPQDTVVQTRYLPMARSALALNSGNAQAAIDALSAAAPYELGHTNEDFTFALYPIYFRGAGVSGGEERRRRRRRISKDSRSRRALSEMNRSARWPI